jgi:hypothetical protein
MKNLVLLMFLVLPVCGYSTSCLSPSFDEEAAGTATDVFVFRLEAVEIDPDSTRGWRNYKMIGRLAVVEVLKGDGSRFDTVKFNSSPSCGTGLDVRHYYLAFTSEQGKDFTGSEANLSNITEPYDGFREETWSERGVLHAVREFLDGKAELDDRVPHYAHYWLNQDPPPPPPPCPKLSVPET